MVGPRLKLESAQSIRPPTLATSGLERMMLGPFGNSMGQLAVGGKE